jgi:predicted transcriptional regulator
MEIQDLEKLVHQAEASLNEALRLRGRSLDNTLRTIRKLEGVIYSLRRDAEAEASELRVAMFVEAQ